MTDPDFIDRVEQDRLKEMSAIVGWDMGDGSGDKSAIVRGHTAMKKVLALDILVEPRTPVMVVDEVEYRNA